MELVDVDATLAAGISHQRAGRYREAAEHYRRVLAELPDAAELHFDLAVVEQRQGHPRLALRHAEAAGRLDRNLPHLQPFLAELRALAAGFANDRAAWERDVAANPADTRAMVGLAMSRMLQGEWRQGWPDFCARAHPTPQKLTGTEWDGSPLNGRTLLVYTEEGLGDAIQFARLVAPLRERVDGPVMFACWKAVGSIMPPEGLVIEGDPLPPFDVHIPLMSLARVLDVTPESIPGSVPYITADPARAPKRLREIRGRKVGIAWAGRPEHLRDGERSIAPALLAPLLDVPGVTWVSVAKDHVAPQGVLDLSGEIRDFRDTAAILANLDLLITVDTSVAHLAGAMGVPTWVMLSHFPDWRWLLDRDDSPWYPSVRLFRQSSPGDWRGVIERVRGALTTSPSPRADRPSPPLPRGTPPSP